MNGRGACQCDASDRFRLETAALRTAKHRRTSRPSRRACPAAAGPTMESASPRDISRRCGARYRCRHTRNLSTMVSSDSTSSALSRVDQLLDAVPHGFGRVRLAAVGRGDRRREEILQFEDAAGGRDVLVGGDARHRRLVHADGVGDGLQIERPQMLHAVHEERVLLLHDLHRDLEDGLGALIERAHQPGRGLEIFREIGFGACRCWRSWSAPHGSAD